VNEPIRALEGQRSVSRKQHAVLDDNTAASAGSLRGQKKEMKSLAHRLKGKAGRMRQGMLGKRVDFAARSVITVDPSLTLEECGLPYEIAEELFKGFIVGELARDIRSDMVGKELEKELLRKFHKMPVRTQQKYIERAVGERRVLLNRQPTLHRLSMLAFKPKLHDGLSLKLHPLVCSPFNADFDGDTMVMHLALSDQSQSELQDLMSPSRNLACAAHGSSVFGPTQDMVLGIYYLTADPPSGSTEVVDLPSLQAVDDAFQRDEITHNTRVRLPKRAFSELEPEATEEDSQLSQMRSDQTVETTAGRAILFFCLHRGRGATSSKEKAALTDLEHRLGISQQSW